MSHSMLLKNGVVLIHDAADHVQAVQTNILIKGNKIAAIGKDVSASGAEVIDCTDKLISPGFVDTHHHVWQTQLKGRHANQTMLEYFPHGYFTSSLFTSDDVFWGQLGGCLEMLDCGTTTVVDYAHMNYSPEHNYKAISATASAGLRSVFCYTPTARLDSWKPFTISQDLMGGHVMPTLDELAKKAPFGDGRISLGFGYDAFSYMPREYLDPLMDKLREHKIHLITPHYCRIPTGSAAGSSLAKQLEEYGYLDERFLMAHSANLLPEDADLYRKRGAHFSSTPSLELQMQMGIPVAAFRDDLGAGECGSIGVDCHAACAAFIPGEARLGLQSARAAKGQPYIEQYKQPKTVGYEVEEAYNLCTIRGARAAKLSDKVGSIAEGKLADLVIFDALSPEMICGGAHDPVSAIMMHSSPADVDTVIVDGVVRKRGGKLVDVQLDETAKSVAGAAKVSWGQVAKTLLSSRERIQSEIEKVDVEAGVEGTMKGFFLNPDAFVDYKK